VYAADEAEPFRYSGRAAEDPIIYYEKNTCPGCRLLYVWLNKAILTKPVSTIDLAEYGVFTLFTSAGRELWYKAAKHVSDKLGIPIAVYSI
jgi:hypothetical protein